MSWPLYEDKKHTKSVRLVLKKNSAEYLWHSKNLENVRAHASGCGDNPHFWDRAKQRGISEQQIEQLRYYGELEKLEVRLDKPELEPMYHVFIRSDGIKIVGVFATDGLDLKGITLKIY